MTESNISTVPVAESQRIVAVMFLADPADPWDWVDRYEHPIAGVPFLLRNILNLQRGGITRLVIYMEGHHRAGYDLQDQLAHDPRLETSLEWIFEQPLEC